MELCLALDLPSKRENLYLLEQIFNHKEAQNLNFWVKIGLRSFIRDGHELLQAIKMDFPSLKIFLDLKLYDIPNTMVDASLELAEMGVNMITIHASSGFRAMSMVCQSLKALKQPPLVFAVTALTSFSQKDIETIYHCNLEQKILEFTKESYDSGVNGVVCSVWESLAVKQKISNSLLTLTPGIRPIGNMFYIQKDDQERVATIENAKTQQADFIVIGRPLYKAKEPSLAVIEALRQIN